MEFTRGMCTQALITSLFIFTGVIHGTLLDVAAQQLIAAIAFFILYIFLGMSKK